MSEGLNSKNLESFLGAIVGIRLGSNQKTVWGKLIGINPDVVLEKQNGRRIAIVKSDCIDIWEME
jgi:hypothetical protein